MYEVIEGPIRLAPSLATEIISPGDRPSEVEEKVSDYLKHNVPLVIVIRTSNQTTRISTLDNPGGILLHDTHTLRGDPVLPGWSMPLAELFGAAE